MKKILIFTMVSLAFLISFPLKPHKLSFVANALGIEDGYIYTTEECGKLLFEVAGEKVYQKKADINEIVSRIGEEKLVGITVFLKGDMQTVTMLLDKLGIEIKSTQTILNKNIIYAYSKDLNGYNLAKARESNIQIAVEDNEIIVGIPVIVGSF